MDFSKFIVLIVIISGDIYNYTMGVDRNDIQLLCDPMDTSIQLRNVFWIIDGKEYPNPVKVKTIENVQLPDTKEIVCIVNDNTDVRIRSNLIIQGQSEFTFQNYTFCLRMHCFLYIIQVWVTS